MPAALPVVEVPVVEFAVVVVVPDEDVLAVEDGTLVVDLLKRQISYTHDDNIYLPDVLQLLQTLLYLHHCLKCLRVCHHLPNLWVLNLYTCK